jgi:hypothetical protein
MLEHVYPAQGKDIEALKSMLKTGLDVKLAKTLDLAAVIHIQRLQDGNLQFTAVPLLYGSYAVKDGEGTFSLQPPLALNIPGGLPIIRGAELDHTMQVYAEYQRENTPVSTVLDQPMSTPAATPAGSLLVRVNANPAPEISVPMHAPKGRHHGAAATTAIAAASPAATPAQAPHALLAMNDNPAPPPLDTTAAQAPPRAIPVATPIPVSANGVALTPFLQSAPEPVLTNNGASWRTYSPGQMPRGRVIAPSDAAPLAETGLGGERLYLRGNFVVTASEDNRAILRPQTNALTAFLRSGSGGTRVIVQYPAGIEPPLEGSTFARDESRPFMITDVRRGSDGAINLYVREITTPQ